VERRLEKRGVQCALVYSEDETRGLGLLDVLPAGATKLGAIEFLLDHRGYAPGETVFAGDSGNDLPVLASALPAVLVANAQEEVRREAVRRATELGTADTLYLARGGWGGMNGFYSAGILEGVAHFRPELVARCG
jgi:hydroxymethylpyrimidine pyrophosphatase-like HAD family hydrolase